MLTRRHCKFFVRDMLEQVFLMICKGQVLDAALHKGLIQAAEPRHARRPQPRRGFPRPNRSRAPPRPHLRHGPWRAPRPLGPAQGSLAPKVQYAKLRAPKGVVLAVVLQHSADHARAEDVSFATTPEQLRPRSTAHSEPPSLTELSHQALPLAICVFIFGSWCMCISNSPFSYQYTEQCTEISLAAYDSS